MSHKKYFLILSIAFLILFLMLSVSPYDRADWALENALVIVFAIIMVLSYRKFPLSRISYTLIFLFMCLHEIGSHYTYALVPYDAFFISNFNFSLNEFLGWEFFIYRNIVTGMGLDNPVLSEIICSPVQINNCPGNI